MTAAEKKKKADATAVALRPENLPGKLGELMAEATILANSRVVPLAYIGNPEAVFAIIQYGKELGVGPMTALQNVAFVNGRPSMGSELRSAVAHKHPEYAGMKIVESNDKRCKVLVGRRFRGSKEITWFEGSFTYEEAQKAGLTSRGSDSAWAKWTKRMLFHRANAFAHMDAFPDVDTGIHTEEEMKPEEFARSQEEFLRVDDELIKENMKRAGMPLGEDGIKDPTEGAAEKKIAPKRAAAKPAVKASPVIAKKAGRK